MNSENLAKTHSRSCVLLTGATGFLGSHLLLKFLELGHPVHILARPQSRLKRIDGVLEKCASVVFEDQLEQLFQNSGIKIVVHCATEYGRKSQSAALISATNLLLPQYLLKLGETYGIEAFINTDTALSSHLNDYAQTKTEFRNFLENFQAPFRRINMCLEHFYGPGDDHDKFLTWVVEGLSQHTERLPLTAGQQKRDFIHVRDVVAAFAAVISILDDLPCGFSSFDVGSGQSFPIKDVVTLISDLFGPHSTRLDFGATPLRDQEMMQSNADTSRLRSLGWSPQISLEEGLAEMIDLEKQGAP